MERHKLFKYLSNGFFVIGAGMAALALYLVFSVRASLPPGVCPIDNNRVLIYAAISVLIISFVFTFLADKEKKKQDDKKE